VVSGSRSVILGSRSVRRTCNHRRRRTIGETERRAGVAKALNAKLDLSRVARGARPFGRWRTRGRRPRRLTWAACCFSTRRSLAAERRYGGPTKELRHAQAFAATAVALRGRRRSRLGRPVRIHPSPRAEPVIAGRYTHVSAAPAAEAAEQAEEAEHQARAAGRGREPVNVSGSQTLIPCLVSPTDRDRAGRQGVCGRGGHDVPIRCDSGSR